MSNSSQELILGVWRSEINYQTILSFHFPFRNNQITKKTMLYSFDERIAKLKEIYQGWVNNYRLASIHAKLKSLDEWLRNRLRYCIWHHWKKLERKRKNLIRLGVGQRQAYAWSRTRMGGWAVAQSPILGTTITLTRLRQRGYEPMLEYYRKCLPEIQ